MLNQKTSLNVKKKVFSAIAMIIIAAAFIQQICWICEQGADYLAQGQLVSNLAIFVVELGFAWICYIEGCDA